MLPPTLRASLLAVQLVSAATLIRSIAYDRWITVLAAVLMIIGATAAQRGRTWGVALTFAAACAFPVAWFIGIAPLWFCLVGVAGVLPFLVTLRALARFDTRATTFLTMLAASLGALGAVLWKELAWSVFALFPSLRPSIDAQHGFAIAALLAAAAGVGWMLRRVYRDREARLRVAPHLRVMEPSSATEEMIEVDEEAEAREPRRISLGK